MESLARLVVDNEGNIKLPTIVLSDRSLTPIDAINNIDFTSYIYCKSTDGYEVSFNVYKELSGVKCRVWDKLNDLSVIWIRDTNVYFEISVSDIESNDTSKTITGTYLPTAELSQIYLFDVEINTINDINRTDFKSPTVFYNENNPSISLLDRVLGKASHYSIRDVDNSLRNIQRTFSFNGVSIKDALNQIEKQVGCKFVIDSASREVDVIDLYSTCVDCGYRGEFDEVCPKCGSTNILPSYGEESGVYISNKNLSESVNITTQDNSLKTVFRLTAGDTDMTAAIMNMNPNGTRYIYNFGTKISSQFSPDLKNALDKYEKALKDAENKKFTFDEKLSSDFAKIVKKYNDSKYAQLKYDSSNKEALVNNSYVDVSNVSSYKKLIEAYYSTIDFYQYLNSSLMPVSKVKIDTVEYQMQNVKKYATQLGIADFDEETTSIETIKSSAKLLFMSIIDGAFKVEVNSASRKQDTNDVTYTVNFTISEYRNSSKSVTDSIDLIVKSSYDLFISQKAANKIKQASDESGIYEIIGYSSSDTNADGKFKDAITYYSEARLESFYDAIKAGIDVIDEDNYNNVFADIKRFYTNRLSYISSERDIRKSEIKCIESVIDAIENDINETKNSLALSNFLTTDKLMSEWMSFRREQEYTNTNFVSTDLDNTELIKRVNEFLDLARMEIDKASREIYTINATVHNLLLIPEFSSLWDKFDVFNWITYKADDKVFRLRLLSYKIEFDENKIANIDVEFSNAVDGITAKNPFSSAQQILSQAKSVASTYNYIQYQTMANTQRVKYLLGENGYLNTMNGSVNGAISDLNGKYILVAQRDNAHYKELKADVAEIDKLYVKTAQIDDLIAKNAMVKNISADVANILDSYITNATVESLYVKKAMAESIYAKKADVDSLDARKANIDYVNANFINADGANLSDAVIKSMLVNTGIMQNATVSHGVVTGYFDATKIRADSITANKISILGDDGLYHRLNTLGITDEKGQTIENALDGSHIIADSITASKINVDDLSAFKATIGSFQLSDTSINSFGKNGIDSKDGVYIGIEKADSTWNSMKRNTWRKLNDRTWDYNDKKNGIDNLVMPSVAFGSTDSSHIIYDGANIDITANNIKLVSDGEYVDIDKKLTELSNAIFSITDDKIVSTVTKSYAYTADKRDIVENITNYTDTSVQQAINDANSYARTSSEQAKADAVSYASSSAEKAKNDAIAQMNIGMTNALKDYVQNNSFDSYKSDMTNAMNKKLSITDFGSYQEQTAENFTKVVAKSDYTGKTIASLINQSADSVAVLANHINLQGLITANSNFKVLADGSIEAKNSKFSGNVTANSGNIGGFVIENNTFHSDIKYGNDNNKGIFMGKTSGNNTWDYARKNSWNDVKSKTWNYNDTVNGISSIPLYSFIIGASNGEHIAYENGNVDISVRSLNIMSEFGDDYDIDSKFNEQNNYINSVSNDMQYNYAKNSYVNNNFALQNNSINSLDANMKSNISSINTNIYGINTNIDNINTNIQNNYTRKAEIIASINNVGQSVAKIKASVIDLSGYNINLTSQNITINSTNFNVDNNGNIVANNGLFKGKIIAKSGSIGGMDITNNGVHYLIDDVDKYPSILKSDGGVYIGKNGIYTSSVESGALGSYYGSSLIKNGKIKLIYGKYKEYILSMNGQECSCTNGGRTFSFDYSGIELSSINSNNKQKYPFITLNEDGLMFNASQANGWFDNKKFCLCTDFDDFALGNAYYSILKFYPNGKYDDSGNVIKDAERWDAIFGKGLGNFRWVEQENSYGSPTKGYIEVVVNGIMNQPVRFGISTWLSDAKFKENINDTKINNALNVIDSIKHREFNWKNNNEFSDNIVRIGYVAQELEDIMPEFVLKIRQKDGSYLRQVDEKSLLPVVTKSIQELHKEVIDNRKYLDENTDKYNDEIYNLKNEIYNLKNEVYLLKEKVSLLMNSK